MTESSYALKIGERIPRHVAIIMDGNGRWAKARGKIRIFGHHAGVGSVRSSVQRAAELGMHVIDAGHFGTEFPVVARLVSRLREELRGEGEVEVIADRESKDFFSLA